MSSAKPKLFTFWEGPKPAYINMCQMSLLRHCHKSFDVKMLDEPAAEKLVGRKLPFQTWNHKTDWLKARLVGEYGGFWIDADMLVLKDFVSFTEHFREHQFIGIPGFFGAPAKSSVVLDWFRKMDALTETAEIGFSDLIQPLLMDKRFKEFDPLTREMICPFYHTGDSFWRLFDEGVPLGEFVTPNTFIVTLYNSSFNDSFKKMSALDILNQRWRISKIFRRALFDL